MAEFNKTNKKTNGSLAGFYLKQMGGGSNSSNGCSPPDFGKMFTKSTDNIFFLRFEGSWMLIIDVCSFKMVCKSHTHKL